MVTAFFIGNIASGKSTATRYLASRGAWRIDLDELAKTLYEPGSPVVRELVDVFGPGVLNEEGGIDTKRLADAAFCDSEHVTLLNGIVHPRVLERLSASLVQPACCCAAPPSYELAVVEVSVPESFKSAFTLADEVVAISAPLELRRARAIGRGMSAGSFDERAAFQPSERALCAMADTVIANEGDTAQLIDALDGWLADRGLLQCPRAGELME